MMNSLLSDLANSAVTLHSPVRVGVPPSYRTKSANSWPLRLIRSIFEPSERLPAELYSGEPVSSAQMKRPRMPRNEPLFETERIFRPAPFLSMRSVQRSCSPVLESGRIIQDTDTLDRRIGISLSLLNSWAVCSDRS